MNPSVNQNAILRMNGSPVSATELGWWFRDVEPVPALSRLEHRRWQHGAETSLAVLPVRRLLATQRFVNADFHDAAERHKDLPLVLRKNGRLYVADGHHRIISQVGRGVQYVVVRFLDLDPVDTYGQQDDLFTQDKKEESFLTEDDHRLLDALEDDDTPHG